MLDRDIRPDFSGHDQTIQSRHAATPAPSHITGPHRAQPEGSPVEIEYLALNVEWGEYGIPVSNLSHPSRDELWDVDRVLWDDDRLVLEVHRDDAIELLIEAGMTQREHPTYERKRVSKPVEDPDVILWERET